MAKDVLRAPIATLARRLREGTSTARQLAEATIEAHEQEGAALDAYREFRAERVLQDAAVADAAFAAHLDCGPLQGIPVAVKDLYGVSGYETFAGAPKALPDVWKTEGPLIRALRSSLAVVSGKTHTVEFAFGGVGTNPHWPTPRNPWDAKVHRVPGGSSSGSGVALWEGSAALALGSDTAGSVRIPASMTGTVGLKTTAGRWPTDGIVPLSSTLDTAGLLARRVSDCAIGFAALDPESRLDPLAFAHQVDLVDLAGARLGIVDWFFDGTAGPIAETVHEACRELEAKGARIRRIELPEVHEAAEIFGRGGLAPAEFTAFINNILPDFRETLDPNVRGRFEKLEGITASEYLGRVWALERLARSAQGRLADVDALVGPTLAVTPPTMDEVASAEDYARVNAHILRNTSIANLLRFCALTLPVGLDDQNMPVGLQLTMPGGDDIRLLKLGRAVERILGTGEARMGRPPLCP